MTITLHTCVGIIVSRMFLIVSMVSCGEAVLLVSLLLDPGLGMLAWLTVGCWSDSLPNIIRAFSEILDMEIKRQTVVIFQQRCFNMLRVPVVSYAFTLEASASQSYIFHDLLSQT